MACFDDSVEVMIVTSLGGFPSSCFQGWSFLKSRLSEPKRGSRNAHDGANSARTRPRTPFSVDRAMDRPSDAPIVAPVVPSNFHDQILAVMAVEYHKLLTRIDWDDRLFMAGIRERLNKFLTSVFLATLKGCHKHHRTHFVSPMALKQLQDGVYSNLIYEHLVPKQGMIQRCCEERAKAGTLTCEFGLLRKALPQCDVYVVCFEDR